MASFIEIPCKQCKKINSKRYSWLNPTSFSNPKKASMLFSFHCSECSYGNAVRLAFLPDQKVEIIQIVDFTSLIKEDLLFNNQEEEIEVILADAGLSLLNDEED